MMSGLAGTMMSGMAFGAGSAVAHQAIGAIMGGGSSGHSAPQQQAAAPAAPPAQPTVASACQIDFSRFNQCMRESNNSVSACDFYYNSLKQCEENNRTYN